MIARPRLRRGFTLIELMTYIGLISVSFLLLMNYELATQRALSDQRQALDAAAQTDILHDMLSRDLQSASAVTVGDEGETLTVVTGRGTVRYAVNKSEKDRADKAPSTKLEKKRIWLPSLTRKVLEGAMPGADIFPRVQRWRFRVERVDSRPLVTVEFDVLRRFDRDMRERVESHAEWQFHAALDHAPDQKEDR